MIPVPSYELIPFLTWLHRRGARLSVERIQSDRLHMLAREFLQLGGDRSRGGMALLMAVFQGCPMIEDRDVGSQMSHFARCGQCIEFITQQWARTERHPAHQRGRAWPREDGESGGLHLLLRNFVQWSQGSELDSRLRSFVDHNRFQEWGHTSRVWAREFPFHNAIGSVGEELPRAIQSLYLGSS